MSRSRTAPVEFREGVNAWASPGALAPIAAVCPGICRSEDYLSQAQAPLLKLAPRIKYPRAFFCCDCYLELIAGALFFIRDLRYKSFQMRIGFAHFFQIVDLRFCHDGPMIIDAFKAIKRRRAFEFSEALFFWYRKDRFFCRSIAPKLTKLSRYLLASSPERLRVL